MNSESEKDEFLRVSEEVASCFLDLYLDEGGAELSLAARSPAQQRANADPTHPAPASPVAAEIAERLRRLGDEINEEMKKELREAMNDVMRDQSILEVTLEGFRSMCGRVLRNSVSHMRTGWDQVTVVYMAMGHMVRELRQQHTPNQLRRENQFQRYVGTYLQDVGLQRWIREQGGLSRAGNQPVQSTRPLVDLTDAPLD